MCVLLGGNFVGFDDGCADGCNDVWSVGIDVGCVDGCDVGFAGHY